MIPLKDNTPSDSFPLITWMLILINALVFAKVFFYAGDVDSESLIRQFGLVPSDVRISNVHNLQEMGVRLIRPFFTNMFMHGGWGHIISNMWILFIFGDNVEDRMGKLRYSLFYICCGLVAGLTHFILYRNSVVPAIGASGAISGIMAAYMLMFPRSTILSLVPILIIPLFIPIPAVIYIGLWFLLQLLSGTTDLMSGQLTGVAFWAHIGGFLGGIWLTRYLVPYRKRRKYPG